jgi:outer membrane protein assembly factor BamA
VTHDLRSIFGPRGPREARNKDRKLPGSRDPSRVNRLLLFLLIGLAAAPAAAQPDTTPAPAAPPDAPEMSPDTAPRTPGTAGAPTLTGTLPPGGCLKKDKPAPPVSSVIGPPPVTWNEFDIEGELQDPPETVRALFTPVMTRRSSLTEDARADVIATATKYGYSLVSLSTRDTPRGTHAIVHLAPLPLVRKVTVDIKQSPFATLLDDQVRRRMRIRTGTYLPWTPADRTCELDDEQAHIAEYLHFDEGYFNAKVEHHETLRDNGLELTIRIELGDEYGTGVIRVKNGDALSRMIDQREIIKQFQHDTCLTCFGASRFTRSRHLEDIQRVVELFQKRGFPAVRVHTTFEQDPQGSFNRATHAVDFTVMIDPRRRLDVQFEGNDPDSVSDAQLRDHLTFNQAASSDDVEAANSARSLVSYLQGRGWFDAHVTWTRTRHQDAHDPQSSWDSILFRIEQGKQRPVRSISFAGNQAFGDDALEDELGTTQEKLSTSLFGGNTNATTVQLAADVDRIASFYRRAGYRDARVRVEVATDPAAFGSAALTAALAAAERGDGVHVRYVIDESEPTLLAGVEIALPRDGTIQASEQGELCAMVLAELADLYGPKQLVPAPGPDRCAAEAKDLKFREDDAALTKDQLKGWLYSRGRPRAEVGYEVAVVAPRRVVAKYTLAHVQTLQIGKVVIRGNFKTRASIILSELGLRRGALFTQDALADGARRLRNTALFDAVNVAMPDLETTRAGEVNAVVEVVERYDFLAQVDAEAGYSSYNGAFLKLIPSFKNLFGVGISFDITGTIGFDLAGYLSNGDPKLRQLSAEATLRVPQWLSRRISPVEFQTELTAFHRRQDTPRFGVVTTDGATLTLSRTWERKRIGKRAARAITTGLHYDFRLRERPIDVLRPLGADDDQTQVPISTRTGSVGLTFEWEQRVDRQGTLSPLAPEAGFRFEGQASLASNYLGGQDTFLKLSTGGTKYWPVGNSLVVRADLRYDQGVPLGTAVLLPEVERFFAGGDATVRGYDDERLATEIVQVGVPPITDASVQQIRILPAGGNIRVMSSLDAQLRIYKLFATALFVDAGMITNQWSTVTVDDIRPSVGMALVRLVTPFGAFAMERAVPLRPQLGDDPRGRWHISFAARAQF